MSLHLEEGFYLDDAHIWMSLGIYPTKGPLVRFWPKVARTPLNFARFQASKWKLSNWGNSEAPSGRAWGGHPEEAFIWMNLHLEEGFYLDDAYIWMRPYI